MKLFKKKFIFLVVMYITTILFFCSSFATAQAGDKPIIWTFAASSGAAANIWGFHPYPRFQKLIEEATHGRLIIDTKVDLFPFKGTIQGVMKGGADMGFQRIPFVSGTFPLWDFASLPFFFKNVYEYEAAINDPAMTKILDETYAEKGLIRLFESPSTPLDAIFGNKAIEKVEDFKGLKVRSSGLLATFTLKLLGASPLTMSAMEISEALKRGTVDAVCTAPGYGMGAGMTDVTKHLSSWPIQSGYGGVVVVNMKTWKALPQDLQEIVKKVSRQMQGEVFFASDSEYRVAKTGIRAAGLSITVPDKPEIEKARQLAKPAIDKWLKIAGPRGPEVLAIAAKYASGAKIMLAK
ncbi:MAG: hypothetical protein GY702_09555 [Desulfobulbaceae bacterium]|nr:hypothetical protein [Desulfobulbaceae bacterium]